MNRPAQPPLPSNRPLEVGDRVELPNGRFGVVVDVRPSDEDPKAHGRSSYGDVLVRSRITKGNPYQAPYEMWYSQTQLVLTPDRADIRRICERIQSRWSDAERNRRMQGYTDEHYTIPEVSSRDLGIFDNEVV